MPNTYTQLHIHLIFAVQNRDNIIKNSWKDNLYKYITGITQKNGHKVLVINGMPDHIHMLIGLRPTQSVSDLVQDIKADSTKWINQNKFTGSRFSWQEGFGAFSYSRSHVDYVIDYIKNQESHHANISFQDEYREFLKKFEVDYNEMYIFKNVLSTYE